DTSCDRRDTSGTARRKTQFRSPETPTCQAWSLRSAAPHRRTHAPRPPDAAELRSQATLCSARSTYSYASHVTIGVWWKFSVGGGELVIHSRPTASHGFEPAFGP